MRVTRWVAISILLFLAAGTAQEERRTGKWFDRIFIVTYENMGYDEVNSDAHWANISSYGTLLTNFHAITHPSQPNYWCQVAGDYFKNTNRFVDIAATNIVDLFEEHGVSWKAYQEDYPGNCFAGDSGKYRRKHNPFISFDSVRLNQTRCAKIVNGEQLDIDLEAGTLPQYSFYTPNMDNDGHDTSVEFAGKYATAFLAKYLNKFPNNTLLLITWDESNYLIGTNAISTILIGSMFQKGTTDDTYFDLYSILKTVEENWDLGNLGRNDAAPDVNVFNFGQDQQLSDGRRRKWLIFGPNTLLISGAIVVGLALIIGLSVLVLRPDMRKKIVAACGPVRDVSSDDKDSEILLSL